MKTTPTRLIQTLSAALVLLHFASCKSETSTVDNTRRAVDPPFAKTIPFRDFVVDADGGDTIKLNEGTAIYIPGGIFQDENGKTVTGNVDLHYRAFYTPGEIAASGITMLYDSAGKVNDFTSAGMFEITGTQNGKKIVIAPGKMISMDFASSYNDMPFNFYAMDTTASNWKFLSTTSADTNKFLREILAKLPKPAPKPVAPREFDATKSVIALDIDPKERPELAGYGDVIWQYAGTGNDPAKNKWIYERDWASVNLLMTDTNACVYNLTLSDGNSTFNTNIVPALKGENYKHGISEFRNKMLNFEAGERKRQEELKEKQSAIDAIQPFNRRLTFSWFGIYNCDIWGRMRNVANRYLNFHFDNKVMEGAREAVIVFVITGTRRIVQRFNGINQASVNFTTDESTSIIAVYPKTGETCAMSWSEFLSSLKDPEGDIKLPSVPDKVNNGEDLDALLMKL